MGSPNEEILRDMIDQIQYRGPDHQEVSLKDDVGLAHSRLSIIDLRKEGNQPMWDIEEKVGIVFNGEIYNYQSLKREFLGDYNLKSDTDTEVIVYLYKRHGKDMLRLLRGMFSLAIYDADKKEMLIAKDRMGQKPLYYSETINSFIFGSELKALFRHPSISRKINLSALNQYLTFDYVPTPSSIIDGVRKLEAGHYMIVKDNKVVKKERYWSYNFECNKSLSFEEAKLEFDELLSNSVRERLMSDVPLGVFLSGGIDSSAVAYYAQKNSSSKIKTFSIGFEDKSYDESDYARNVAEHIGSEHVAEIFTPQKAISLIEEIYPKIDEPFADASLIPTYYLSKITRQEVTVALGGDGSDELLAGYPTFISNKFKNLFQHSRFFSLNLLRGIHAFLPKSDKNISLDFKINQFVRGYSSEKDHLHPLWLGSFLPKEKNLLFSKSVDISGSGLESINDLFDEVRSQEDLNQIIHLYCRTYLHDDILVKVDRASMLNSLEVRAPFLDVSVVEFLNSLPPSYKMRGLAGKHILKSVMRGKIPDQIIDRPKKGFGIPLSKWLRADLHELRNDLLSSERLQKDGIFNPKYIEELLNSHDSFKKNNRKLIWNLLIFQLYMAENRLSI